MTDLPDTPKSLNVQDLTQRSSNNRMQIQPAQIKTSVPALEHSNNQSLLNKSDTEQNRLGFMQIF